MNVIRRSAFFIFTNAPATGAPAASFTVPCNTPALSTPRMDVETAAFPGTVVIVDRALLDDDRPAPAAIEAAAVQGGGVAGEGGAAEGEVRPGVHRKSSAGHPFIIKEVAIGERQRAAALHPNAAAVRG